MKKLHVIGASIAAAALIGSSAAAANAQGFGGGDSHGGFGGGSHSSFGGSHGQYGFATARHDFNRFSNHGSRGSFTVGPEFNHHWLNSHFGHRHHQHLTFAQKQAEIVARLQAAETRLTDLVTQLTTAAQADPNGWAAQALPFVTAQATKVQNLITAVQAATDWQQLWQAFHPGQTAPTPPTTSAPAPTSTPTPTAPTSSTPAA